MTPCGTCHTWVVPAKAISWQLFCHRGPIRFRPQAHRGRSPLPHRRLTYYSRFPWGLGMVTAIPLALSPSYPGQTPRGLCKISSHPKGRRGPIVASAASFAVLLTETLVYHCAANRISTLLPDYHAFYTKPNYLIPDSSLGSELLSLKSVLAL